MHVCTIVGGTQYATPCSIDLTYFTEDSDTRMQMKKKKKVEMPIIRVTLLVHVIR